MQKMQSLQDESTLNNFIREDSSLSNVEYKNGFTNNVFQIPKVPIDKVMYYIPAYLRLKVKNLVSMDLFTLSGQVNCTFILSIYYSSIHPEVVTFLKKSIEIAFHKSDAVILDQQSLQVTVKDDKQKKLLNFTIRKVISTQLFGEIFWSPFETVKFIISLTLRKLQTQINGITYIMKFNLMDCADMQTKFSLAEETSFGVYELADNQLYVEYTNKFEYDEEKTHRKNSKKVSPKANLSEKEKQQSLEELQPLSSLNSIKNFQYAHFILPAYKIPNPTLLTIYFPLLLLGIINIGIFYQENRTTGKTMLNISALIVSFIALIPTVRENTAVSPTVTFTQILVFLESFTTLLTWGHMIQYRNEQAFEASMDTDGYIIACVVITAFVALCVLVLMVLHRFYWKRLYHKAPSNEKKQFKFVHDKWYNYECDKYFHEKIENVEELILQETGILKEDIKPKLLRIQSS